jgi:hypothetical protein
MGFYPGYADIGRLRSLESLIGRKSSYVVQFADQRSTAFTSSVWGQVARAGSLQTLAKQVTLVESVPLAFGNNLDATTAAGRAAARTYLSTTANGAWDAIYRTAARYINDGGFPDAIIRVGWEFDGTWYPWSANGNEALWASAYRRVVDVFRSVSKRFRFEWSGDPGYLPRELGAYPGDDYVDIIGFDVYDKAIPVPWNSATKSWVDPNAAWSWILTNLKFQKDFAVQHKKKVSYPEWALAGASATAPRNVGGDNPVFVAGMCKWLDSLRSNGSGSLAYHAYFNVDAADGRHRIDAGYFPKAEQEFSASFAVRTRR